MVKGSDEPFVVEPPSVTGTRLCQLLHKYGIDPQDSRRYFEISTNCDETFAEQGDKKAQPIALSKSTKDTLYRRSFQIDREALNKLNSDVALRIKAMTNAELNQLIKSSASPQFAFHKIQEYYKNLLSQEDQSALRPYIEETFRNTIPSDSTNQKTETLNEEQDNNSVSAGQADSGLSQKDIALITAAHDRFIKMFLSEDFSKNAGINVSDVDQILSHVSYSNELGRGIYDFYRGKADAALERDLRTAFREKGLGLLPAELRSALITEIYQASITSYIVSTLARIMPVFIVAILFGLYFGRLEINSISFAAAFAAFLLIWPIILLWDNVVVSKWSDYKQIFFLVYAGYIVTFGVTGRAGALLGAFLQDKFGWQPISPSYSS
jgi:hypothetical protein